MRLVNRLWVAAALVVAVPSLGWSQQTQPTRRVAGQVNVEGSTEPVPEATVQVVGTTLGTIADPNGRFELSVPTGARQLRVRRIGYAAKIVPVGANDATVSVSLARDVLHLDAQVVTGQATTVSRSNAANSVAVVSTEQLNRAPHQTVEGALQGKVPGAVITSNSGAPGGGIQLQLRGSNTINGNYQPLYVVDGTIVNNGAFSNGLNAISSAGGTSAQQGTSIATNEDQQVNRIADLNPEDIETIEILKGPSAGAIYGSRGANGVVIITTKRGKAGQPSLDAIQRFGTTQLTRDLNLRCFTQDQATAYIDAHNPISGISTQEYFKRYPYAGCSNPMQQLYGNNGLSYETSASLRGGSNDGKTTYFASGMVKHDAAITSTDGYDKQSLRLNLGREWSSRLNLRGNSEIIHTLTKRGIAGNDNSALSPTNVISTTPTFFDFSRRLDNGQYAPDPFVASNANILQDQQAIQTPENVYRMLGSAQADYALLSTDRQKLNLTLLGAVDHFNDASTVYSPPFTYFEQSGINSPFAGNVVGGNADVTNANLNLSLAHVLTTQPFTATTSAGLRQERSQSNQVTNQGQGLFPGVTNYATAVRTFLAQGQSLTKNFSYYAQEEFLTLNERLLLTAAVNTERSSTNGDPRAFYAYPKFSGSFKLPWLPPKTDLFKLRLAYGKAGNQVPVDYKYTYLTSLPEAGVNGLLQDTRVGLSNVKPEQTAELEGGFDATFFGGRAGLEFTQYRKKTTGLVLTAGLGPSTGYATKVINGGSLQNTGTEIGLNLNPIQTGAFSWTSNTTFTRNRNRVLSLTVPAFTPPGGFSERFGTYKIQTGYSATQIVAFKGFDSTFVNGKLASVKRHEAHIGDQAPDFQMGFTNDFTLGRFRLSSLVDWRKGGYVVNLTDLYFDGNVAGGNLADTALVASRNAAFTAGQPVYVQHASFAKLRELALSYDVGPSVARHLFGGNAQDLRLELSGRNLYTWTHYNGFDPEVSNFGNAAIGRSQDVAPYPPSRQIFLSLNATF
ncbi:MAG: SusC/RagA family TonB-linked outer membrane protein [Gemmatimonadaceae bacterium]